MTVHVSETLPILAALAAGAAAGGLYFFGLWLTVSRLARTPGGARSAALWLGGSLLVRLSLLAAALALIAGGDRPRLLAALTGLLLARLLLMLWPASQRRHCR